MGDRTTGLQVERLGRVSYPKALEIQAEAVAARRAGRSPDRLLLLEHPPVVTLGRSARAEHLLVAPEELARRGIALHHVARGGDVTYHGPGQLVGYPIVDLAERGPVDVHAYLRELEAALIEVLARLGVQARRLAGFTGVFVADDAAGAPPRKIASIGVALKGWVTCHGFALNVTLDPADFGPIVPCGLRGVVMTSVARELGPDVAPGLWQRALAAAEAVFAERWSGPAPRSPRRHLL